MHQYFSRKPIIKVFDWETDGSEIYFSMFQCFNVILLYQNEENGVRGNEENLF